MTTTNFLVIGLIVLLMTDAAWRYKQFPRKTEVPTHRYGGVLHLLLIAGFAGFAIEHYLLQYTAPFSHVRVWIGVPVAVLGTLLILWARTVLGQHWSPHVYRVDKQQMVKRGPYAIIRHPIYIGEAIVAAGLAIYFGSASLFFFLVVGASIYNYYRASKE